MEKRNVVESGRTPDSTEKTAEVADRAAGLFERIDAKKKTVSPSIKEIVSDAVKTVTR